MTASGIRSHHNNFNLLRFIAASMVLFGHSYPIATVTEIDALGHSWLETTAPHLAVDIFFVISGFLVTGSLMSRRDVVSFIIARSLRIVPGLIIANFLVAFILGAAVTSLPLQEYWHHADTWNYWWQNSFPIDNITNTLPGVFTHNAIGYGVNGSLWTLPWEIKMYGLLALFGTIAYCRFSPLRDNGLRWLVLGTWLLAILGLCHYAYRPLHDNWWELRYDAFRFAVYFFGGAVCQLYRDKLPLRWSWLIAIVLIMVIERVIKGWCIPQDDTNVSFILRSALFAYVILFIAYVPKGKLLAFNRLGDYSYGIYIYAYPVQQATTFLIPGISPLALTGIALPITLLLSILSWHYIEQPALNIKDRVSNLLKPATRWLFPAQTGQPASTTTNLTAQQQDSKSLSLGTAATMALALIAAWLTYLQPGTHLYPGLDNSWAYGINYAYAHNLVIGRDIYFTFGPLGFLEHTRPLTDGMIYASSLFWLGVSTVLSFCLLQFGWMASNHRRVRILNIFAAVALVFCAAPFCQRLLLTLYVAAFLFWQTQQLRYLILMAVTTAVALLIKFTYGTASMALFFPFLALHAWRTRTLKASAIALATFLFCYVIAWPMIYGTTEGFIGYIRGGLDFARGSTSAMAFSPRNNWPAVGTFFLCTLCAVMLTAYTQRRRYWMPLVFLPPLFIWSKYAFGLEDSAHLAFLYTYSFYITSVFLIACTRIRDKILLAAMMYICLISWQDMHNNETGKPELSFLPDWHFSTGEKFFRHDALRNIINDWRQTEQQRLQPLLLPDAMRNRIGNASIDIYPWETIIAAANQLNWTPRPIFQNYISYTPFLDGKNAAFYNSDKAPEFLVWHYHDYQDIANRFPLSSDPQTIAAILTHYQIDQCSDKFCLWKKSAQPQLSLLPPEAPQTVRWNEWISVPDHDNDIIRASVIADRTIAGKLNLAAWKEGAISIEYRLRNGAIKAHDLVIDNAISGVWISPYRQRLDSGTPPQVVERHELEMLLANPPAEGYIEVIEQTAGGIKTTGWGLVPFVDTRSQQMSLLLYNDNTAYTFKLQRKFRADITAVYHKQGEMDLDQSGFDEEIAVSGLPPGLYHARIVINNGERTAISVDRDDKLVISQATGKGNVDAIRLISRRPWAFTDTLQLSWQFANLNGTRQ